MFPFLFPSVCFICTFPSSSFLLSSSSSSSSFFFVLYHRTRKKMRVVNTSASSMQIPGWTILIPSEKYRFYQWNSIIEHIVHHTWKFTKSTALWQQCPSINPYSIKAHKAYDEILTTKMVQQAYVFEIRGPAHEIVSHRRRIERTWVSLSLFFERTKKGCVGWSCLAFAAVVSLDDSLRTRMYIRMRRSTSYFAESSLQLIAQTRMYARIIALRGWYVCIRII